MDIKEATDVLDVFMVQVRNEEDITDITAMMLSLAWQTFVKMLYKNNYEIVDRAVSEEYVKQNKR
jgi:hypothetical protein